MRIQIMRIKRQVILVLCVAVIGAGLLLAQMPTSQARGDYNGDGSVGFGDVLALVLNVRKGASDSALDYNADGTIDSEDPLDLLLDVLWRGYSVLDVVVAPAESNEYLLNPGVGFTAPNTTDADLRRWNSRYPLCSTAYYRWYWDEVEPADGQIDFDMIDAVLKLVREEDMAFAWRIMCQNGAIHVPQWLIDKGVGGSYYDDNDHSKGFMPDYADPIFIEHHERLIRAMAGRYDGHPDIHHVDIGSVGSWGEWNNAGTPGGDKFALPPDSTLRGIMDLYLDSFKKTKLVMLIGGAEQLTYGIANGTGYRADCLGDWGMWGPGWNHMVNSYPPAIEESQADDAWMHAPIAFEACGTGTTWYTDGMGGNLSKEETRDITIQQSLDWHISVMNLLYGVNYDNMPNEWVETYNEWAKKMGYRYVLRQLAHPSVISAGGRLNLEMDWDNVGVAPCYYAYPLAVRFRDTASGESWEMRTDEDLRTWLPGEVSIDPLLNVPGDIPAGEYALELALLDPHYGTPRIKLAVDGAVGDGWYGWSTITVR
jgi:hypothetical protein